jgi:serine/threonine-protein kinase
LRIGKYEVLRHIASGGMGAVYRARDVEAGREVALKVLSPELAANPTMIERFRREARAAAQLRHENIVGLYEFGEVAGTYFLALEFVDGIDLHDYIQHHGPLSADLAREFLKQAVKALAHAHAHGIVHRDIKPSNFLVTEKDGQPLVKLTDLGLARQVRAAEGRITRDGTTVGTVDYMSPEQAHDSNLADIRSDLYSLGCTVYHMLAGHPPFPEGSLVERITRHVNVEPPDIRGLNAGVPEDLAYVLGKLLRKKPEDRYQTPLEVLRDLLNPESVRGELPRLMPQDPPVPVAGPRPSETPPPAERKARPTTTRAGKTLPEEPRADKSPPEEPRAGRKRPRDSDDDRPRKKKKGPNHWWLP